MKTLVRICITYSAIVFVGLSLSPADGAQPGRRRARFATPPRPTSTRPNESRLSSGVRTYSPYDVWMNGSSKYYGGFHVRYFNEMLYPSGDRPIRGTAW